jgi:hypothetical protein
MVQLGQKIQTIRRRWPLLNQFEIFDSHVYIVDHQFPLVPNNGYLPNEFTHNNYLDRIKQYDLCGGAIVSGSF